MPPCVRNLYFKGDLSTWYSQYYFTKDLAKFLNTLEKTHRVQKLMQIIRTRTPEAKAQLKASVIDMCHFYIQKAPLLPPEAPCNTDPASVTFANEPSAYFPKDGIAYAYLLSYLDEKGDMLPLLVQIHKRQQDASYEMSMFMRSKKGAEDAEAPPKAFTGTAHGAVIAYACGQILRKIILDEELKASLSTNQKSVLEQFTQLEMAEQTEWEADVAEWSQNSSEPFDKRRPDWRDMESQSEILPLAEAFVNAGQESK